MKKRLALFVLLAFATGACVSGEGADTDAGSGSAGTTGAGGGTAGAGGMGGAAGAGGGATTGTGGGGTGAGGNAGSSAGAGGRGGGGGAAGASAGNGGAAGAAAGTAGRGGNAGSSAGAGGRGGNTGGAAGAGGRGGAGGTSGGAGTTAGRGGTSGSGGTTGTGGTAAWLAGYTATMFGNHTAGDCSGLANFSDTTNISGATCTHQGVTLAPYMSGVANDSSFYGAPGDESSIWVGPTCTCQSGQTENSTGMCPSAPSCNMEQDCGKCFQIKCDPSGTGTYSNGDTRMGAMYCNANQSVVIEVIDACPHNHPSNTWWCTNQRKNHIDVSCSAMKAIIGTSEMAGSLGWVNVQVRPVDCSVGLGVKTM